MIPASASERGRRAGRLEDGRLPLVPGPAVRPRLPRRLWRLGADARRLHEGDLAAIAAPMDFLGVNYYSRRGPSARERGATGCALARSSPRWAGRSIRRASPTCCCGCTGTTGAAPRHHRERRRLRGRSGRRPGARPGAPAYLARHIRALARRARARRAGERLHGLEPDRQLRVDVAATPSASAWCTSTTRPSTARSRTAGAGTATSWPGGRAAARPAKRASGAGTPVTTLGRN